MNINLRTYKQAVVAQLHVLIQQFLGGTEENHEKLQAGQPSWSQDLNPGYPEYEGILTTRPQHSVGPVF